MKKLVIFAMMIAMYVFATSCSSISNGVNTVSNNVANATSNTAAKNLGSTCGTALHALYKSFKSTGKIEVGNSTVLSNLFSVSTCISGIKANSKNSAYRSSFIAGMIGSSNGLITNANASAVVNALVNAPSTLSNINSATPASNIGSAANAIIAILNLLGK